MGIYIYVHILGGIVLGRPAPCQRACLGLGGMGGLGGGFQEAHGSKTPGQREPIHAASQGEGDAESGGPPVDVD